MTLEIDLTPGTPWVREAWSLTKDMLAARRADLGDPIVMTHSDAALAVLEGLGVPNNEDARRSATLLAAILSQLSMVTAYVVGYAERDADPDAVPLLGIIFEAIEQLGAV